MWVPPAALALRGLLFPSSAAPARASVTRHCCYVGNKPAPAMGNSDLKVSGTFLLECKCGITIYTPSSAFRLLVLYAVKKVKTNNSAITTSVMVPFNLLKIIFQCLIFMGICGLLYVEKL